MIARNIMTKDVITVGASATVKEAAKILTHQQVSGAPVVDGRGRVVGVVSEADILEKRGSRVKNIMSNNVYAVAEDTRLEDIAVMMMTQKINRVPVLRDDRLVGIVSRADLIGAVARGIP